METGGRPDSRGYRRVLGCRGAAGPGQPRTDPRAAESHRIVASPAYAGPRFGPARWLSEGGAYTTVEQSSIVRYDGVTGERRVLVDASRLVPRGRTAPLGVADYRWSDDGRRLLIFTNTQRVWRQNTRGDYWVLDLARGGLTQLGAGAPESTLMFAKFSPDATRVAYVRANNVYVERLSDGRVTPLTDGRIRDDDQRHGRLGLRRRARCARRVPLEPRRPVDRLLAVRQHGRRPVLPHQHDRRAVPDHYAHPVSQGRHHQLRGAHRRRQRRRRRHPLDADARRSAQYVPRAPGMGGCGHRGHSTVEPAAESARSAAGRRADGRDATRVSRRVHDMGGRRRHRALDSTRLARSSGRPSATDGDTSTACRGLAAKPRSSHASTPTSLPWSRWTRSRGGFTSERHRRAPPSAFCTGPGWTAPARRSV